MPTKNCQPISTIADSTMAMMVFFWSVMWCSWSPPRRAAAMSARERAFEFDDQPVERRLQRRAPADQHIVMPGRVKQQRHSAAPLRSAGAARGCARPRCRPFSTPWKPMRGGAVVAARTRLQHRCAAGTFIPVAAAKKSDRCFSRSMGERCAGRRTSGTQPLASSRAGHWLPCGRPWSPCGRGNRDGACAPACSVDRSASREATPLSRLGAIRPGKSASKPARIAGKPASGAADAKGPGAYTGGPDAKSMQRGVSSTRQNSLNSGYFCYVHAAARASPPASSHDGESPSCGGGLVYSSCDALRGREGQELGAAEGRSAMTPVERQSLGDVDARSVTLARLRRFVPLAVVAPDHGHGLRDRHAPPPVARDARSPPHGDRCVHRGA